MGFPPKELGTCPIIARNGSSKNSAIVEHWEDNMENGRNNRK
jgi:hypothetical protein